MENLLQIITIIDFLLTLALAILFAIACAKIMAIAKHVAQPTAAELRGQAVTCAAKGLNSDAEILLRQALYKGLAEAKGKQAEMDRVIKITTELAERIKIIAEEVLAARR
ncbi:MAG: hypothetical protein LBG19_13370 [Prevotellaceae bacterium]|jgi:hypothetical protein|nr:hypothetical protein [Prevotellaceae bacterium]